MEITARIPIHKPGGKVVFVCKQAIFPDRASLKPQKKPRLWRGLYCVITILLATKAFI